MILKWKADTMKQEFPKFHVLYEESTFSHDEVTRDEESAFKDREEFGRISISPQRASLLEKIPKSKWLKKAPTSNFVL